MACLQLVSGLVLRSGFSHIERAGAAEDVSRVHAALDDAISKMNGTAGDWAWWDDTYRYALDRNPAYTRSNLGATSISTLRINTMVLLNPAGQIVFGTGFDSRTSRKVPLAATFRNQLVPSNPLLQFANPQDSKQGILMLPEGPVLVAVRQILTSNRQGPSHGTLIFGRNLDSTEVASLAKLTRFPLQLQRLDAALPPDFEKVRPLLSATNRTEIQAADENTLWGYTLIDDIDGNPALLMRVAMPRAIFHQQQNSLQTMFFSLLIACFAFCFAIFWLLEKVVLGRLSKLDLSVRRITHEHDPKQRIELPGSDELSLLGLAINDLLDTIARSQGDLLESENRFRTFMDHSPAIAFVKDANGRFVYINATFERYFNHSSAQVLGKTDHDLWSAPVADIFREHDLNVLRTGKSMQTEEMVPITPDRTTDWLIFKFPLRNMVGGILLAGMGIDITQRKLVEAQLHREQQKLAVANSQLEILNDQLEEINKQLEKQALHDELTQLFNRRAFNQQLKTEMERAERYRTPLSLLILDIDQFKLINDSWGHSYGDEVLQRVAKVLQSALRTNDIAARYGGEEMAVILPNTDAEGALAMAERCRTYIERAPWRQGQVTASFGASTFRIGMESTAFIAAADAALYTSKKQGRNRSTHIDGVVPHAN
ncbi:diguanylate cyclase [bacterium]|nr:MAG: diguanylate cyclase [bacterium]